MFYTKGDAYLLSIKELLIQNCKTHQEDVETQQELSSEKPHIPSSVVHYFIACFENLLMFLWISSLLSILSYIYTILLLPLILTATGAPTNTTDAFRVPLDIQCPFLTPRIPPSSVHDLRPDDIRIIAGIGDSVMAAFAAKGIQGDTFFNMANLYENRGVSFAMGGVVL